jgi:hypothetical protein
MHHLCIYHLAIAIIVEILLLPSVQYEFEIRVCDIGRGGGGGRANEVVMSVRYWKGVADDFEEEEDVFCFVVGFEFLGVVPGLLVGYATTVYVILRVGTINVEYLEM